MLRKGARAEGQDIGLVHPLQQVQSLTSEAPPTIPPYQCLGSLRLGFIAVFKSCQCEPAEKDNVLLEYYLTGGTLNLAASSDLILLSEHVSSSFACLQNFKAVEAQGLRSERVCCICIFNTQPGTYALHQDAGTRSTNPFTKGQENLTRAP